jgi:hypothetical protein
MYAACSSIVFWIETKLHQIWEQCNGGTSRLVGSAKAHLKYRYILLLLQLIVRSRIYSNYPICFGQYPLIVANTASLVEVRHMQCSSSKSYWMTERLAPLCATQVARVRCPDWPTIGSGKLAFNVSLRPLSHCKHCNGRVSDEPRRLPRHQRAQAHNSTHTVSTSVLCTGYVVNKTVSCVLMNMILVAII